MTWSRTTKNLWNPSLIIFASFGFGPIFFFTEDEMQFFFLQENVGHGGSRRRFAPFRRTRIGLEKWRTKFLSLNLKFLKITCFHDDEFSKKNLLESRSEKKSTRVTDTVFFLVLERNATYTRTGRMFFKNGQFFNQSWSRRVVESHWGLLDSASAPFKYLLTNDKYGFSSIASFLETQQRLTLLNSPAEPSDF